MAYAVPPRWSHGDQPDATEMNKYSDALNAIYATLGDNQQFYPVADNNGEDVNHWFTHRYRWLWFSGDGTLTIPALGIGDVAITDSDSPTRLDLSQYNMGAGTLYYVSDCVWAMETRDP